MTAELAKPAQATAANSAPPRQGWIDTAKALAIYLVVLGHLDQSDRVSSFLWTFHVPLFFFVSGYLSKAVTPRAFGRRLLTRLALPYVYLYVANVCLSALIHHSFEASTIGAELLGIVYGTHAYPYFINAALWFLPALMIVETLHHLVLRRYPLTYAPLVALSYLIYRSGHIDLFLSFDLALLGLNFFIAGALLRRFQLMDYLAHRHLLAAAIMVAATLATLSAARVGNVWYTGPYYALSLLAGLAGIAMVLAGSWLIDPWLQRRTTASRVVRFVSTNTLFILCFHQYSASLTERLLPSDWLGSWLGSWLGESMLIAVVSIAMLAPFNLLILRFLPSVIGAQPKNT